jgi:hypothetical protein
MLDLLTAIICSQQIVIIRTVSNNYLNIVHDIDNC